MEFITANSGTTGFEIEFETDNKDNIYLHDTNQRYLFGQNDRSLSLGCVRVQDWPRLAQS